MYLINSSFYLSIFGLSLSYTFPLLFQHCLEDQDFLFSGDREGQQRPAEDQEEKDWRSREKTHASSPSTLAVEHHFSFFFYFYILEELYLMVHTFIIQILGFQEYFFSSY